MELFFETEREEGLAEEELRTAMKQSLEGRALRRVLLIPPDFTRFYSNAGFLTNTYYHLLRERGCQVDILPALGTHVPVSREEAAVMFGDIPYETFQIHNWKMDVISLGEVPGRFLEQATDGLWCDPIRVEINRRVLDPTYDLILSIGQVVPHEVIGMANHSKNLFVGVGGSDMINKSHMVGAIYGMERMMGRDHSPVRQMFDYAMEKYLKNIPIVFALTVCTAPEGKTRTHGLFIGDTRRVLEEAISLSQEKNMFFLEEPIQTCVVYLDPKEFKSTWLGNKAIYRTRMAMANGGDLIILAPGVERFGEDSQVDQLIRKYGYRGRASVLEQFSRLENQDLRDNMGAAAHLIHGSSDGRFTITYAVKQIEPSEMESVGFNSVDYDTVAAEYDPQRLQYGWNQINGKRIFFIPNPALGLWSSRDRFKN